MVLPCINTTTNYHHTTNHYHYHYRCHCRYHYHYFYRYAFQMRGAPPVDGKFCPIFVQPHIPHPFGEEGDAAKARLGGLMGMTSVPGYLLSASPESIAAHNTTSMPKKWAKLP